MTNIQLQTTKTTQASLPVTEQGSKSLNGMQQLLMALLGSLDVNQDITMVQVSAFGILAAEAEKYQKEGQKLKLPDLPDNPTDTEIKNFQAETKNILNQKDILSKKTQAISQGAEIVSGRANEDIGDIGQVGTIISGLLGTNSDVNKAEIDIINIRR